MYQGNFLNDFPLIVALYDNEILFNIILRKIISPTSAKHRSINGWYYVVNRLIMYTLKLLKLLLVILK